MSRRSLLTAAGAAVTLALAACTATDPLAQQANAGDNKNYIAGDGSVTEYAAKDRKPAVQFSGMLFDGSTVNSSTIAGKVTVLNFWYAGCAPCRLEAPDLEALYKETGPKGVLFYGVNIRDEAATADAFNRTFSLTYPSFHDKDGAVLLAMTDYVPPAAVPTTLVLDKAGRVSARILGVAEKGTLKTLISSALAQSP
ncbi:TlpA family protein disulfide reductase [Paenarthrobacter sp. Z7-10]|uniref:TlpA family protein disulfide reductase n=1 Tax=Paenarthrobacter sp. Z7-10 TaxID=2787635 RepID=UPI0022A92B28|nr:TlpA disulfide reductase family protein [Paenarthrobacter sp. Z7-10]MCZ2401768.1 TlpA family protein disulfide reductase [Paenarthrobacter sp. Z7-10]